MGFLRVTSGVSPIDIEDLGYTVPASSTVVLSDQFSVWDLYQSADLEALIIASTLTVELDYGTGWSAVAAGDYTNRDCLATFLNLYEITNENNNEDLVDGSEVNDKKSGGGPLHIHDARYYTETEISGTGGAALVGTNQTPWTYIVGADVQAALNSIDGLLITMVTLDHAYDNDSDGILDVDGSPKDLNFRSDNSNDVLISRWDTTNSQNALLMDVSGDELLLGALVSGALAQMDVRVLSDLIVDGDITFTGTITDTTVNELNVENANIRLRDQATGIAAADAYIEIERGTTGVDSRLLWNETTDRWQAGLVGTMGTIGLLEFFEIVTGVWEFQGSASTDPAMYLTDRSAAPTTQLGTSTQIPMAMVDNWLVVYDKTRSKWFKQYRQYMYFGGRDFTVNGNEYLRAGLFVSSQSGPRLMEDMTLVGIASQTSGVETWTARVRKNGSATNLASMVLTAVDGDTTMATDVDFVKGDRPQVYCEVPAAPNVNRPFVVLMFAPKAKTA